jgi:hypothetical protein
LIVENLPIINKTKHSTKRERKRYKMEGPKYSQMKYIANEVLTNRELGQIKYPTSYPQIARSISDKERGGMFEKMLS